MHIYCSGPLFSPEELGGMSALARVLEADGFGTFLPQRDGIEAYVMRFVDSPLSTNLFGMRERIDQAIFALDIFQIVERCAGFVFNMNGRVPDEGGVAEAAVAFSVGRPVLLYKNDRRSVFHGRDNSMITGLSPVAPVSDLKEVPHALRSLLARTPLAPTERAERLRDTVRLGQRIWKVLERLPAGLGKREEAEELIQEIAGMVASGSHS